MNKLPLVKICVKAPKRRHFSLQTAFPVGHGGGRTIFLILLIKLQIFLIFFNIHSLQPIQIGHFKIRGLIIFVNRVFFYQETEKHPNIIGVGDTGASGGSRLHSPEIVFGKRRKRFQNLPQLLDICHILLFVVTSVFHDSFHPFLHKSNESILCKTVALVNEG